METLSNGALPCFGCGLVAPPHLDVGTGPHARKATCAGCGRFLKWLKKRPEERMIASVNRVVLLGTISKHGVEVRYGATGAPSAALHLVLTETGQDGKTYTTLVPCEIWGKRAEQAGELAAGQLVVFEGRLRRRMKGEQQWELVVSGFDLTPIAGPVPVP